MKKNKIFILLVLLFVFPAFNGRAQTATVSRTILGLYDSTESYSTSSGSNMIHRNAEMVLNWLGVKVRFFDVSKGLPDEQLSGEADGILTWYLDNKLNHAEAYCDWLKTEIEKGKKVVILSHFGAMYDPLKKSKVPQAKIQAVFRALGLSFDGLETDLPQQVSVEKKDSTMVEFERTLDKEVSFFQDISSVNPDNKIYLQLVLHASPNLHGVAVVVTPQGGYVMPTYVLFRDYRGLQRRWRINPFRFFEEAFQLQNTPRFDTTTLLGSRVFYTHIDGDGFRNLCEFDPTRYSSEIIYDEILKVYPLPFAVSFIGAEIDSRYLGSERFLKIAKKIWSLDYVEAGSHEFSHPLDWKNQLVSFPIKGYAQTHFLKSDTEDQGVLERSPYKNAAYVRKPQTVFVQREIEDVIHYFNDNVASPDKKVIINQWSGNCLPPAAAIQMCQKIGVKNINGGDSRFDRSCPSYTGLASLTRTVDDQLQFYSSNSNENIYTNLWSGSFYAFQNVIETFQQTEIPTLVDSVPRRVSPINIYYHFYSGEKKEALKALKKVYDYALDQPIIPLYASEYVSIVQDFYHARWEALGDGGFRFSNFGTCRTVRFDHENRFPDLQKSKNILGFCRWHQYLYVFLSDANSADLFWTSQAPTTPYLQQASGWISKCAFQEREIRYTSRGFGETRFEWLGFKAGSKIQIKLTDSSKKTQTLEETADSLGQIQFSFHFKGPAEIVMDF